MVVPMETMTRVCRLFSRSVEKTEGGEVGVGADQMWLTIWGEESPRP